MCTYKENFPYRTEYKEVRELLDEIKERTGEIWEVEEHEYIEGFFRKRIRKSFTLYKHIYAIEYQVINFYLDETEWSINPYVSVNLIMAYLYGYLGGLSRNEKERV